MAEPTQPVKTAAEWLTEIQRSRDHWKKYRERACKTLERYRDEEERVTDDETVGFNILYSNTETLKPAVYAQAPRPDVRRRFMDKDPVGKAGSEVLQRCLAYSMDCQDIDGVLESVRDDYVLPGFACARVEYRPYITGEKGRESLAYEEVVPRYHPWDMFAMSRSRSWQKVWWVAFGERLTKDEATAAFGDKAAELAYGHDNSRSKDDEDDATVLVWEVWNKRTRTRFFVAEGAKDFLKSDPDPLNLEQFFPCPKPLWMLSTTDKLVPIPEYYMYRKLALELDDVTDRIKVLVSALRRRGVYNAAHKDTLSRIANSATDNHFEPIEDWASFLQNGGLKASMEEQDLSILAETVLRLYDYRDRCLNIIYQVTGIADIIRGASSPSETATAQAIKGKYAGMRIGSKQKAFAKFTRDLLRLMGEVIAERFSPQMLSMQSGVQLPYAQQKQQFQQQQAAAQQAMQQWQQQAQMAQQQGQQPPPQPQIPQPDEEQVEFFNLPTWEDVLKILRNDKLRGFKIDIETDSTILQDKEVERQQRIELLQAIGGMAQGLIPAVQAQLVTAAAARELITFAVRAFAPGSQVEQELDEMGAKTDPRVAAQQQQLQQQAQELQQRAAKVQQDEAQAKDAKHQAEMAGMRAQMQKQAADHADNMLEIKRGHEEAMKALMSEHHQSLEKFADQAGQVAEDAIGRAAQPMNMEMPQ